MNQRPSQTAGQVADPLPQEMIELVTHIQNLPEDLRQQIEPTMHRVIDFTRRRRRILNLIQEALNQLRLDMKYLVFDLEATRRERDEFRQQVDGQGDDQ